MRLQEPKMMMVPTLRFKSDASMRRRLFVSVAMNHPAKGHLGMWQEMVERYSRLGDTILDPLAGIGTTLVAALMGRNVVCVELEVHFVDPMRRSWEKMRTIPMLGYEMGNAQIFQGDARDLSFLEPLDTIVTSPPFETTLTNRDRWIGEHAVDLARSYRRNHPTARHVLGNKRPSFWAAEGKGYTRPDTIVTSPPYESQEPMHDTAWFEAHRKEFGGGGLTGHYTSPDTIVKQNVGNESGASYWASMLRIYAECFRVLKPGGIMALVLKGYTRGGKYVDLPAQTETLLLGMGWLKHDHWRRQLWALSFWRTLQRRRNPEAFDDRLNYEEVLAFRKQA